MTPGCVVSPKQLREKKCIGKLPIEVLKVQQAQRCSASQTKA